jgi:hypothetical protein
MTSIYVLRTDEETKKMQSLVAGAIRYLKSENNTYWLNRIANNKTLSGKYQVAQKLI